MATNHRRVVAVLLVACAGYLVWWAGLPASPDFTAAGIAALDAPVPTFAAPTLAGNRLTVSPDLAYPVVVNFWGVWCAPCAQEMPVLERLYQQGIPVIGIHVGQESPQQVAAWVEQVGITFPIIMDDSSLERRFRVMAYPTTFFVDANGIIQHIERGALTESSLASGLAAMHEGN